VECFSGRHLKYFLHNGLVCFISSEYAENKASLNCSGFFFSRMEEQLQCSMNIRRMFARKMISKRHQHHHLACQECPFPLIPTALRIDRDRSMKIVIFSNTLLLTAVKTDYMSNLTSKNCCFLCYSL
jgi:hypothetical protein